MADMDSKNTNSDDGAARPIPQPRERLFVGNLLDVDGANTTQSLRHLAELYGPIFQLRLKDLVVFVSSQKIVHFLCDESRFHKVLSAPLLEVRNFAGDGLFTAFSGEANWTLAHRVLIPAFGPLAIKKMQGMMLDIIAQMLMYWEHHAGQPFEAADQYTRLTFDTIGWCAFRYRFNSFHTEKLHPFIDIMVKLLLESQARARRPGVVSKLMYWSDEEYNANIKELHRQCDEIVNERRQHPDPDAHDLLNNMILDRDPKSGAALSDENIRFQMVTFLIAGHETTSGMLSFATYYLLKNPRTLTKAREEADRIIAEAGGNLLDINPANLKYIDAICKETLRLQPTAPAWAVTANNKEGETLPGGYHVPHAQTIAVLLHQLHRDPAAWGADADEFVPERWLDGREIPQDAWKPFGNGARACIGRGFAMQEAHLALALIVNRFDIEMADASYDLEIKQTLTIKPHDFRIVVHPRKSKNQSMLSELIEGHAPVKSSHDAKDTKAHAAGDSSGAGSKIYVYYGSNSGSCEGLAKELVEEGRAKGFKMVLGELDTVASSGKLPTDAPVIICTASYEGKPTDNARMFVEALTALKGKENEGVKYLVMGAGHHDWAQTFHRIPKLIDTRLEELGAERILPLSLADAGGDIVGDFEEFKSKVWEHFGGGGAAGGEAEGQETEKVAPEDALKAIVLPPSANPASKGISAGLDGVGTVLAQDILVEATPECAQKNCIRIKLPEDQTYRSGDYLAVLAKNPQPAVDRALKRFNLKEDASISFSRATSFLPAGYALRAEDLLSSYVELGQPISKRIIPELASFASDPREARAIQALGDDYVNAVTAKRLSLLDILEANPSCTPPLEFFLLNLPKMKIRQYSISSTPLDNPSEVTLTYTVHTVPSKSGRGEYLGVASNYLAFLHKGDSVFCSVKASAEFHLPLDPATPVVMFAAGSGVAPFHGFVKERVLQAQAGRNVGKMILFYGCRNGAEVLHAKDLAEWTKSGLLDLRPVFSRSDTLDVDLGGAKLVPGTKYVQDRVWEERDDVREAFEQGAQFYTCGSGAKLGADLRKTLVEIIRDVVCKEGKTQDAEAVMERLSKDRYRTDVFL